MRYILASVVFVLAVYMTMGSLYICSLVVGLLCAIVIWGALEPKERDPKVEIKLVRKRSNHVKRK